MDLKEGVEFSNKPGTNEIPRAEARFGHRVSFMVSAGRFDQTEDIQVRRRTSAGGDEQMEEVEEVEKDSISNVEMDTGNFGCR